VITRPLVRHTAEQLVARLQSEIWQSSADTTASRLLFNEVLRPVATQLEGVRRLIVVPDQTYADTSFAALVDGRTNRFVFENQIVVMATSASDYVGHAGTRMAGRGAGALVVDAAERADSSARTIAALYSPASLLTGSSVTPDALFAASAQRSVIHVSAPLSPSATNPMLSRLMVADDPGSRYSGAITGSEIVQRPWSQTRLVVLDEVRTSQSHRGEGTSSLARAFIAAGVPAVLGTLRGADESAARDLLIGFHREMSKGMSAEQALQTVQRNAIQQNGRRLGAWSALVLYGSDR